METENPLDKIRGHYLLPGIIGIENEILDEVEKMLKKDFIRKSKITKRINDVNDILAGCRELQKLDGKRMRAGHTLTELYNQEMHLELLLDELKNLRDLK